MKTVKKPLIPSLAAGQGINTDRNASQWGIGICECGNNSILFSAWIDGVDGWTHRLETCGLCGNTHTLWRYIGESLYDYGSRVVPWSKGRVDLGDYDND